MLASGKDLERCQVTPLQTSRPEEEDDFDVLSDVSDSSLNVVVGASTTEAGKEVTVSV